MKHVSQLLLVLLQLPCPAILGNKLDLLMLLSLRKGGLLPPQSGEYLMDSFRTDTLIPAFGAVEEQLRSLNTSDHWHVAGMLMITFFILMGNMLLAWRMINLEKKQNEMNPGNPV